MHIQTTALVTIRVLLRVCPGSAVKHAFLEHADTIRHEAQHISAVSRPDLAQFLNNCAGSKRWARVSTHRLTVLGLFEGAGSRICPVLPEFEIGDIFTDQVTGEPITETSKQM